MPLDGFLQVFTGFYNSVGEVFAQWKHGNLSIFKTEFGQVKQFFNFDIEKLPVVDQAHETGTFDGIIISNIAFVQIIKITGKDDIIFIVCFPGKDHFNRSFHSDIIYGNGSPFPQVIIIYQELWFFIDLVYRTVGTATKDYC
jgi:hypothetical protein